MRQCRWFMKRIGHNSTLARRLGALFVCLLIVFCMGSYGAAAVRPDCCGRNYCPMAAHQSTKHSQGADAPMNCYRGVNGFESCSLSCCHPKTEQSIAPSTFVLSYFVFHNDLSFVERRAVVVTSARLIRSTRPFTPPPRPSVL